MKIITKESLKSKYITNVKEEGIIPELFAEKGSLVSFEKGEMIIRQSYQPNYFYYIVKGSAQVRNLLPNGKLLAVNILKAPCFMGEMELIDSEAYPLEVFAREETWALAWEMNYAKEILLQDVQFLKLLAKSISNKERLAIEKLAQQRGYSANVRLAQFILDNSIDGVFRIKKVDVADFLGISYRHTEKLFNDFVEERVLEKKKTNYYICDETYLKKLLDK